MVNQTVWDVGGVWSVGTSKELYQMYRCCTLASNEPAGRQNYSSVYLYLYIFG